MATTLNPARPFPGTYATVVVRSNVERIGLSFGPGRPLTVDPVPRVIDAAGWERLEAGLLQRARALNAFVLDAYGNQRIF